MPGTREWYNVKYDGEDDILTLKILFNCLAMYVYAERFSYRTL